MNTNDQRIAEAARLMLDFAGRTGLDSERAPRRYLWTDAFAVCNFLALARATGDRRYKELALRLIEQVHRELGRHRPDDPREGWISGLDEKQGAAHPTCGGLRIGKPLAERGPEDPMDEQLEWERDGQYFHYLTKWMHALDQMSRSTGDERFNLWARELARRAIEAFTYRSGVAGTLRMYWKMSIDLTRPLVRSMGQHDPLDGYITCLQLQATPLRLRQRDDPLRLDDEIRRFETMIGEASWASADPLAIGGLLVDAYRVKHLVQHGDLSDGTLLVRLLEAARAGLGYYAASGEFRAPAEYRLAFRELGLAIGLRALAGIPQAAEAAWSPSEPVARNLEALSRFIALGEEISSFWRSPEHRASATWSDHRDINEVMLATCLAPHGFLELDRID